MLLSDQWKDFEIIDTGDGEKLERWGKYTLIRPDPQVIWPAKLAKLEWDTADAHYIRSSAGGGSWEYRRQIPGKWSINYNGYSFYIEPTGFKHTGLFPEQAVNWKWMETLIRGAGGRDRNKDKTNQTNQTDQTNHKIKVLNLFAYTGGSTIAAAAAGAEVCHVDAAKGMVARAKDNLALSGLSDRTVRFIADDVLAFVQREKRRGSTYDGIIMDPPSYGRGPKGELWKLEDLLYSLVSECAGIMSERPLFFLLNSYTTGLAPSVAGNILELVLHSKFGGKTSYDELGLPVKSSGIVLPCGASGRWEAEKYD